MLYMEALDALENGKVVMRESETFDKGYLIILPGTQYIYRVVNAYNSPQVSLAMITRSDFRANDWKVLTDPEVLEALKAANEKPGWFEQEEKEEAA